MAKRDSAGLCTLASTPLIVRQIASLAEAANAFGVEFDQVAPGLPLVWRSGCGVISLWSAYAAFLEGETGMVAKGRWGDLTVMDVDPFALAGTAPERILGGRILLTVVEGRVVFER